MENVVFTQLTVQELRNILSEEIRKIFAESPLAHRTNSPEYLTIRELSKMLNLAVPSIYGMVHRRLIPFIKRGKKLIFEKSQIEEWLKNGRRKTRKEIENEIANRILRKK